MEIRRVPQKFKIFSSFPPQSGFSTAKRPMARNKRQVMFTYKLLLVLENGYRSLNNHRTGILLARAKVVDAQLEL
jgi:hypothetical protein